NIFFTSHRDEAPNFGGMGAGVIKPQPPPQSKNLSTNISTILLFFCAKHQLIDIIKQNILLQPSHL
ncbi:MAG: hypothetical protein KJ754_06610, partial [Bacteroidetes bacterium]|nr:hypothetical protein [Bacteroidota bacterium]MBU1579081.1 hypothetical protein [Bacteroidota bacterium]